MNVICKSCQQLTPIDESYCIHCGISLVAGQTYRLTEADLQRNKTLQSSKNGWGSAFIDTLQPLILEIAGQQLMLPSQPGVVLGRWSFDAEVPLLDVDLSYFGASTKGVSRRHIIITRKGQMAYVADLGTRTGTWLNNQRLVSHNARVLRNTDHLRLGQLDIRILFGKITAQLEIINATNVVPVSS